MISRCPTETKKIIINQPNQKDIIMMILDKRRKKNIQYVSVQEIGTSIVKLKTTKHEYGPYTKYLQPENKNNIQCHKLEHVRIQQKIQSRSYQSNLCAPDCACLFKNHQVLGQIHGSRPQVVESTTNKLPFGIYISLKHSS
jgi:hypothetical protein